MWVFCMLYKFTALYGVTTSHGEQIDVATCACNAIVRNQEELDRLTQIYFVEELESIAVLCGLKDCNNVDFSGDAKSSPLYGPPDHQTKTADMKTQS